jgi:hypothetical protein
VGEGEFFVSSSHLILRCRVLSEGTTPFRIFAAGTTLRPYQQ